MQIKTTTAREETIQKEIAEEPIAEELMSLPVEPCEVIYF